MSSIPRSIVPHGITEGIDGELENFFRNISRLVDRSAIGAMVIYGRRSLRPSGETKKWLKFSLYPT